jgi:hypothetical protein
MPTLCSSTSLVKMSAARLNRAPASMAPLTRRRSGIGFVFVAFSRFVEPAAGNVEAVFYVVEEAAGEGADQLALGLKGVFGNLVGLDPVSRVENPFTPVDDLLGAFRNVVVPWSALG